MVILRARTLHWIQDQGDDPKDLCAHGAVEFSVYGHEIVRPEDGEWCVSAAAIYLLRTLSRSHTKTNPVGVHLFPHCGHTLYSIEGQDDVLIVGCALGIDCEVVHDGSDIIVRANGHEERTPFSELKDAVFAFSDQVKALYESGALKEPFDEDEVRGFAAFRREWSRRRGSAD